MQNSNFERGIEYSSSRIAAENARFMTRVYGWMTLGIGISALVAFKLSTEPALMQGLMQSPALFYTVIGLQFAAVLGLSFLVNRLNSTAATLIYLLYSALTGVTFSVLFMIYKSQSIAQVFGLTAISFAGLSGFGLVTKRDLGPVGSFCMMGLFGMVGYALLSMFFPSMMGDVASRTYSAIGLVVFAGLTAYDSQKIKEMNVAGSEGTEENKKRAIYGALTLYLDFINLFVNLLRLMGNRR
ncbi:MAG: Bax inhibitor-1/YccA family protein [Cryobacterium sp.]|nr:Bax inhibitor-1/YccA family protein [Oligoflexia bacterium]